MNYQLNLLDQSLEEVLHQETNTLLFNFDENKQESSPKHHQLNLFKEQ